MDKRDIVSCAVWLILSVFVFTASLGLGVGAFHNPGAGFIPFWASIGLAFFTCLLPVSGFFKKTEALQGDNLWKGVDWGNNIIAIAALIVYCIALPKLGYLLSTFGLMLVLFSLGKMTSRMIILGSLITAMSSYGLFVYFFGTPLPRGILGF